MRKNLEIWLAQSYSNCNGQEFKFRLRYQDPVQFLPLNVFGEQDRRSNIAIEVGYWISGVHAKLFLGEWGV